MSIIGRATKSRGDWNGIKPVERVKESATVYNRKKFKQELREAKKHGKDYTEN